MSYDFPSVYVERESSSAKVSTPLSGSTSAFIGIAERGELGTIQEINSWSEYTSKFAKGLNSPFYINSYLAYAVYGYFSNGGSKCYVIRVAHETATKASVQLGNVETGVLVTAMDEGTWGNKLSVVITANATNTDNFNINIISNASGSTVVLETFTDVSNTITDERYFKPILDSGSNYVTVSAGTLAVVASTALTSGVDGISDIVDTDYTGALALLETKDDISMVSIPGQSSSAITTALINYSLAHRITPFPDLSPTITVSELESLRATTLKGNVAVTFPTTFKVIDPLSPVNALKEVPTSGHYMGMVSRMITNNGIGQSPAGVDAVIKGAVELPSTLTKANLKTLYTIQVNPIVLDSEYGVIVWGDKSLSTDRRFVRLSNLLLANYLENRVEKETKWVVFQTINTQLMERVTTQIEGMLIDLWRRGNLQGESAKEAFFVKCDDELNTKETKAEKKFLCQIAYKPNESADFVIFTVSHKLD